MPKIGPTGKHPLGGPQFPGDRGGINVGVRVLKAQRQIIMKFGTTLSFLTAPVTESRVMAERFRKLVRDNWGDMDYNASELPITVQADAGMITSILPRPVAEIHANPEVFLAWAQRIDEACHAAIKRMN